MIPVETMRTLMTAALAAEATDTQARDGKVDSATSTEPAVPWRILLWTAPGETRIGRRELLEAVGRPASWLYRHTGPAAEHRIPHRKLDGELVFVVGEIRAWLREREEIIEAGPMDVRPPLRAVS